jgi:diadenylate cyclase
MEAVIFSNSFQFWTDFWPLVRWWDLVDIFLVSVLIYQAFLLLKGTRALQIFFALSFLFLLFWFSDRFEIRTVRAILGSLFENWILILILLFHQDIRRALSQFGQTQFFTKLAGNQQGQVIEEVVRSCVSLANKKIGALLVIERVADVSEFIEAGVDLDAKVSREILTSIFIPVSPLHDGAVLLRESRIVKAGGFLPLSLNPLVSKSLGTRHRAALGITEETDAVCIVVSEEKGSISYASSGKITHDLEASQLRKMLMESLTETGE